jgi:hypothetical protein
MDVFGPTHFFTTLALMYKNLRFILTRGNTIVARFLLYLSAIIWSVDTLFLPSRHWMMLHELIRISPNLLNDIVVWFLPLAALIYGVSSMIVLLAKVKIPYLTVASSLTGALIWTIGLSLDIAVTSVLSGFPNNFTEIEATTITATLLAWWLLARDLLKVSR